MNLKKSLPGAVVACAASLACATVPEVSSVVMTQSPSRLVTVTYTLSGEAAVVTLDVQTNAVANAAADDAGWTSIGGEAVCTATGDVWKKVETGARAISWRPDLSWPDHKIADGCARAVVTAWATGNTPAYMVVDVSAAAQPATQTYYPAADFLPGGVTNAEYKTSSLLLRKILAKDVTWTMGSTALETARADNEATHKVTLDANYYIGVYEVTQAQYAEVATNSSVKATFAVEGSMRPMESVTYAQFRNDALKQKYSGKPDDLADASFLGLLRLKTGLDFDLPTEAQWEFAARAGNGSGYWGDGSAILGGSPDANLARIARYQHDNPGGQAKTATFAPSEGGTAIVGSYAPNAWGLYDMNGNVYEACRDWDGDADTSVNHIIRGGSWYTNAGDCRPAARVSLTYNNANVVFTGYRLVCTAGLD